jgi:hypothetical protein
LVLRAANRLLSARRSCTRWNVSVVTIAGTGMPVHSSRGRSTVLTGRGTERPCRRAARFSPAGWWMAMVLPNTAVPA